MKIMIKKSYPEYKKKFSKFNNKKISTQQPNFKMGKRFGHVTKEQIEANKQFLRAAV